MLSGTGALLGQKPGANDPVEGVLLLFIEDNSPQEIFPGQTDDTSPEKPPNSFPSASESPRSCSSLAVKRTPRVAEHVMEDTNDSCLADRLRREDPEQFHTLVRMHLSFVLDLNTDDSSGSESPSCPAGVLHALHCMWKDAVARPAPCSHARKQPGFICSECVTEKSKFRPLKWGLVPFKRGNKCPSKGIMEGVPLTQEGICQVYQLIEFLSREHNISQEGIFRRSGSSSRQQELKTLLNQGATVDLNSGNFSVHDCASVLKGFLAELPECLLTDAYYPAYCQVAEFCDSPKSISAISPGGAAGREMRLLRSLQLLLLLLPTENRLLLSDLIKLLHDTAEHEGTNKMSADSLATLFTPHFLCPRKLTPEAFHAHSQAMSGVVAFMIRQGTRLFNIPPNLATDIRAYWAEKERRKLSPKLDESVHEGGSVTASTVFTFLDRARTAQSHEGNPTETALAALYAHIQSLPESTHKRRLVKQFNRENGPGTPQGKGTRNRSLGDSIKKHIFNKSQKRHKYLKQQGESGGLLSRTQDGSETFSARKLLQWSQDDDEGCGMTLCGSLGRSRKYSPRVIRLRRSYRARISQHTFDETAGRSWEDDTSLQHLASQEKELASQKDAASDSLERQGASYPAFESPRRSISEPALVSTAPLLDSGLVEDSSSPTHICLPPPPTGVRPTFTSTPAPPRRSSTASCLMVTPSDSTAMSPITRSAQRMPPAMQETMMTPRCRKPVLLVSDSDLCHLAELGSWEGGKDRQQEESDKENSGPCCSGCSSHCLTDCSTCGGSLTDTFRSYLLSRSLLTASPVDLSFSSRTEDFETSDEDILNRESPLNDSLLYCLNGNPPPTASRKRSSDQMSRSSTSTEDQSLTVAPDQQTSNTNQLPIDVCNEKSINAKGPLSNCCAMKPRTLNHLCRFAESEWRGVRRMAVAPTLNIHLDRTAKLGHQERADFFCLSTESLS
uniref:Rho-GAP domain-containing protein n=1 Tax=Timema cristinae TaxID=61476 RepID=A0A7R9D3Z5_TIMCR|nr:unnamed protein product [Timema cristinae]